MCIDFGFAAYQADNSIIQQEILSHRKKPAPIANLHRYLLANATINKNVIRALPSVVRENL